MKNIPAVRAAVDSGHTLRAEPQVIVDWNLNRFHKTIVDNYLGEYGNAFDNEAFPVDSIAEPLRPLKGINKARIGHSKIGEDYYGDSFDAAQPRFYVSGNEEVYNYWTSPVKSDANGILANTRPYVFYGNLRPVNKIVITTENSWATAKTFSIQVNKNSNPTESAGWMEVASQATTGNDWKASGQIVLRWDGSGWITNQSAPMGLGLATETTSISGVRIVVTELEGGRDKNGTITTYINSSGSTVPTDGKNSFFDLIEISARLEVDMSEHIINSSSTFDMGDVNDLAPVGTVTSNVGSVTLSNIYSIAGETRWGLFSKNNTDPNVLWSDYVDANAEVTLYYKYYDQFDNYLGSVQEFKMYTNEWQNQSEDEVEVDLIDYSKFFNEINVRSAMWENMNSSEIVWRLLDSIGFNNHEINLKNTSSEYVIENTIPVFYTTGENTMWEVLNEIAEQTQTAIYFDHRGVLKVRTRELAYSPDNAPVYTLNSQPIGNVLPNIIDLTEELAYPVNYYTINYQQTDWSPYQNGIPVMQQVWEPEGTVTVRSTQLRKSLTANDTVLHIDSKESKVWPFKNKVNIQGEIIEYEGKEYQYYLPGGTLNKKYILSTDEMKKIDQATPVNRRHNNNFTGKLKITGRGLWNSEAKPHSVDANGYNVRGHAGGTSNGFNHIKPDSRVQLKSIGSNNYSSMTLATRAYDNNGAYTHYGTKIQFIKEEGRNTQRAGIVIHNSGSNEDGYYIELGLSRMLDAKERKTRQEAVLYTRNSGKDKQLDTAPVAIAEGIDYELDVEIKTDNGNHRISVYLNGKKILSHTVTGTNRNSAGRFGMFIRGNTKAQYEYLYALRKEDRNLNDDFSFLDKAKSSFMANQWHRDWIWGTRQKPRKKKNSEKETERWKIAFYDEFGPYIHEIREFDVKFEPAPVLHSRLYMTNDWGALYMDYGATPFGAKFTIVNTTRINAVINGDDTLSFAGSGQSVSQVLTVFGRALEISDAESVVYKNEDQILRRGKIESEFGGTWIQSEEMAKTISKWLGEHFSWGNERVTVDIFGNTLLELGDVVQLEYPEKDISGEYFVTSINNSYDNGITTSLGLMRRVISS